MIAVFAGPSGGHLFPALAFAEAIRVRSGQSEVILFTSRSGQSITSRWPPAVFREIIYLPDFPFPARFSFKAVKFLLEFLRAFILSSRYLSKKKPDLCVGFGSYVSYPGMLLSAWRGILTLIHEQNLIPGKATEWLAPSMDCVAVTFDDTFKEKPLKRCENTGLPIRSSLCRTLSDPSQVLKGHASRPRRSRLLIMGGSQGANTINRKVLDAFSFFDSEEKREIAVIHITGKTDFEWVSRAYEGLGIECEVHPFFEKMEDIYRRADMAVTRAGANTLFELAMFKIPAIVIPYPYAGGHQAANARFFESHHAILSQAEHSLESRWLSERMKSLTRDVSLRKSMSEAQAKLAKPDASLRLAELAERLWNEES